MSQTVSLLPRERFIGCLFTGPARKVTSAQRQTVINTKFSVQQPTVVSSEQPIDPSVIRAAHYSAQQQTVCAPLSASCRTFASTFMLPHVAAQRAIIAALQRSDILPRRPLCILVIARHHRAADPDHRASAVGHRRRQLHRSALDLQHRSAASVQRLKLRRVHGDRSFGEGE